MVMAHNLVTIMVADWLRQTILKTCDRENESKNYLNFGLLSFLIYEPLHHWIHGLVCYYILC